MKPSKNSILEAAAQIFDRYAEELSFPVLIFNVFFSNQLHSNYSKEFCRLLGIDAPKDSETFVKKLTEEFTPKEIYNFYNKHYRDLRQSGK